MYYLVYTTVMYAFLGSRFGESCIAVFVLLDSATAVCSAFEGVPFAAANHFGIYLGEKNPDGIRKTFQAGMQLQSVLAVILSTAVIVFGGPVAAFFGMSAEYAGQTIMALRVFAASFLSFSWLNFYHYYFFCLGVLLPGVCLSATQYLVVGIGVNVLLGLLFGEYGIYAGVFLECPLALIAARLLVRRRYHTDRRRLYDTLRGTAGEIVSYDLCSREDEILRCRSSVEAEMKKREIPGKTVMLVLLSLEESCLMTGERKTGLRRMYDIFHAAPH